MRASKREIQPKISGPAIPAVTTQEQLDELCFEWQTRLRLLDWNIVVGFARTRELRDADGECDIQVTLKKATIKIIDPRDYAGSDPFDGEQILCHELMHVACAMFSPADWESPIGIAMEQMIDLTACALVRAKRGQ